MVKTTAFQAVDCGFAPRCLQNATRMAVKGLRETAPAAPGLRDRRSRDLLGLARGWHFAGRREGETEWGPIPRRAPMKRFKVRVELIVDIQFDDDRATEKSARYVGEHCLNSRAYIGEGGISKTMGRWLADAINRRVIEVKEVK
jgi:hypothetical protein